jgi:hypothetical protein
VSLPTILTTLAAIAAVLIPIFTFIEKTRKLVADAYRWVFRLIAPKENPHRVELRITPDRTGFCQWSEGSVAGKPCMHVNCKLYLVSVGPSSMFQILDVSIKKPKTQGFALPNTWQRMNPRLPHAPSDTRLALPFEARFTVEPPVVKSGQKFVADIVLVDQFAKPHTAKKVEFQPVGGGGWADLEAQLRKS